MSVVYTLREIMLYIVRVVYNKLCLIVQKKQYITENNFCFNLFIGSQ